LTFRVNFLKKAWLIIGLFLPPEISSKNYNFRKLEGISIEFEKSVD